MTPYIVLEREFRFGKHAVLYRYIQGFSPRGSVAQSSLRVITALFAQYSTFGSSKFRTSFESLLQIKINLRHNHGPKLQPDPTSPSDSTGFHPSGQSLFDLALQTTANSIFGLVSISFAPRIARHIFQMYSRYKDPSCSSSEATNYDFFSFIHGHIIHVNCWTFSRLSDAEKMAKLGIREEVSDAILDEKLKGVFGMQSLEYWIEDTLRINYATLLRLQDRVDNEEIDLG
ncbi:hypothetical protein M436DRAFT_80911 [Aureobasidium namibiae CBS 147.97]|uniref:Uncharacterized protein n=1 Tax=Aureobasidium namibiae CBS 147.97 TaxID=1043004 RepID=A0A074WN06_9PEZI